MKAASAKLEPSAALDGDDRWALVLRIAGSVHFAKAVQLREILLYASQHALLRPGEPLREQEIACSVLSRRDDFIASDDNIVRVQMGRLRLKLEQYFSGEGSDESLRLVLPKGTYLPHFEPLKHPIEAQSPRSIEETVAHSYAGALETPANISALSVSWKRIFAGTVVLLSVALVSYFIGRRAEPRTTTWSTAIWPGNPLLQEIFVTDRPVTIVVADTDLVIAQNLLQTDISTNDYISVHYPENILKKNSDAELQGFVRQILPRRFTSLGDLNIAVKCAQLGDRSGAKIKISFPSRLSGTDFETGNFIMVGSRTGDPWVSIFEDQLNFLYEQDPATHKFHFRNRHRVGNEQEIYYPAYATESPALSYIDVALLPNLSKTGYVLLLNGATTDANEAAIRYLFGQELPAPLAHVFASKKVIGLEPIEILLKDQAIDGSVSNIQVVAIRGSQI